jgi:hypothetical protein
MGARRVATNSAECCQCTLRALSVFVAAAERPLDFARLRHNFQRDKLYYLPPNLRLQILRR